MWERGTLHAPAALTPGKNSDSPLNRRPGEFQSQCGRVWRRQNLLPQPGSSTEVNMGALTTRIRDLNADEAEVMKENMETFCFRGAPKSGAPCICIDCCNLTSPAVNINCLFRDLYVERRLPARAKVQMILR